MVTNRGGRVLPTMSKGNKFFPFRVDHFSEKSLCTGKADSYLAKVVFLCKMVENIIGYPFSSRK